MLLSPPFEIHRGVNVVLTQLFCQQSATIHRDHSLLFHITFIPSQHHLCIIPRVGFYLGRPAHNQKQIQKVKINAVVLFYEKVSELFLCYFFIGWDPLETDMKYGRGKDMM